VQQTFLSDLARAVGPGGLLKDPADLLTYESDGLVHLRATPAAVVLPTTTEEVQAVVRLCRRDGVPFVARGHGSGLSGGALPVADGVVIGLSRMNRILEVDIPNLRAVVEPGVTNLAITKHVAPFGCYYAPDPSSQIVCSIGGNIAENSGGAHCLKYGFTVHHVLGVEAVLPDGEIVHIGGAVLDAPGLDLLGVIVGSEGTLAIVTKATVRLLRRPEKVTTLLAGFASIDAAGSAVSAIIADGIVPAAVEMMDRLTIDAAEASVHPNFPKTDAVLIVELDGPESEVDELFATVESLCRSCGAITMEVAKDQGQRERIWKGRKAAFAAMGRVSPNYYVQDGVVPRTKLPEVLRRIRALEQRSGLRIGNVFHAGDGNLHPLICYDEAIPGQATHAEQVASEILQYCVDAGGSITGEHGVGADKKNSMARMFAPDDLDTMQLVRCAFDPTGICNPGKVFPTPRLCGEVPGPYRRHPLEQTGVAERF
jgi:glycolate oxidase